ncbi:MAG: chain-length determining protein [Candidatus Parcubacteria bacterium]|nr:chain-length determining protein [Burkholderiales bacterium]
MTDLLKRYWTWRIAGGLIIASVLYWGLIAVDRYVSESHVLIENLRSRSPVPVDLGSLLGGGANSKDLLQMRDYLLSTDMARQLDEKLKLREHYSSSYDMFSRLWSKDVTFEWFMRHYLTRVQVEYDDYAGVLVIRAQAYTPTMAHAITSEMVTEGERFMNELARRLAREQVEFAEQEAAKAAKRVAEARQGLLAFQNKNGLVSPRATVESFSAVVARLEGELSSLQARRRVLEGYLAPGAADLVQINSQVKAVEQQLDVERGRLASPKGRALNVVTEQYERMLFETEFTQEVYKTSLAALEQSRIEATRTLKKVSVLQTPTLPEYALEPRRVYNITLFVLAILLLTGIVHLLMVIVREHRD